jgi:hypothetical protein
VYADEFTEILSTALHALIADVLLLTKGNTSPLRKEMLTLNKKTKLLKYNEAFTDIECKELDKKIKEYIDMWYETLKDNSIKLKKPRI